MRTLWLGLVLILLSGCGSLPPSVALRDANLAEGPVLIQRAERFYLRYRRSLRDDPLGLACPLGVKKTADAGYYYFTGRVSHPEWGQLIERPLAYDEFTDFARRGRVYWLDPDGTQHPIPLRKED